MDEYELTAELARIRERARQCFWRNWLLQFLAIFIVLVLGPELTRNRHDDLWSDLLGIAIGFVIISGLGFVAVRRRWRVLPEAPLSAGLPRESRLVVRRDLRRGTPNPDPVLRAVEEDVAERYRKSGQLNVGLCLLLAAGFGLYAALGDDTTMRVIAGIVAAVMTADTIRHVSLGHGLRAFG